MELRFCPRCGASRLPGAMYCGVCGFAYGSIESGASDPVTPAAGARAAPPALPSTSAASPGHLSATASLDRVRDRRRVVNGFVRAGAILAAAGILLPLLGAPHPAAGLAPIGSGAETTQLLRYLPLVVVAVLIAVALTCVAAWTRDAIGAGPALIVTGAAGIGVIVLAVMAAGYLGYDAAGEALPAVSLVVAGGASLLVAAMAGALIRE